MKKTMTCISMIIAISVLIICCTKTNEEKLSGSQTGSSCDTTSVKYSTDVLSILQVNCYGCHGNGNTGGSGGINLDGYTNLKTWADNGYLVGNVRHDPGFIGMPYGEAKLPDCEINKIVAWVNQGALNN